MRVTGAALLAVFTLLATGCANLPDASAPQAIGTVDRAPVSTSVEAPAPGREPDLLLRDFVKASTDPANRHLAARQYLTKDASSRWDDADSATIVDKIDLILESRSADRAVYTIRANRVGQLEEGGLYQAQEGTYEAKFSSIKVDGEWRIDNLPNGVIMDRPQFLNSYQRKSLYFLDPTSTTVVPDPRWIAASQDQIVTQLIGLLLDGPKPSLAGAVGNELGSGVAVLGPITKADGQTSQVGVGLGGVRIDFQGLSRMNAQSRELLAAQVVWTLANADISGPYVLLADGQPLDERYAEGWTTADVASYNPLATSSASVGLHALRGGGLVNVTDAAVNPVPGYFGASDNLRSAAISRDGTLTAAVAETRRPAPEPQTALVVGTFDGNVATALEAQTVTRPTWALDGATVWAVVNDSTIVRVVRETGTGKLTTMNVESGAISALGGPVTELRLSRDGVRAALIVDGKVYVATVVRQPDGEYSVTNPRAIAHGSGTRAVSLDWSTPDTVVVVRDGSDVPVVQLAVDGSRMDSLPSRNLTSPVVAVDATSTTEFVADARAVFQLNNNDPAGDRYWREVPGLTGTKAIPVLPG
ncbi:MtrAB system accessory lipoprotein LpqB [Rhodococcus sp. SGAir0479]|uniref:MtrAB system accessory lipoprotein LpqB n=1 Tax=Rhodococcus sp. SGAir0479 TaxID=2567884 RepID=UPI0010CD39F5|nr:MtrAB system accessory lipoprotein LpqB [Rhodococcus sp. SGAir0479]QCQ93932.1 MtrAB system accessory protein LpqB [Rhodococcus sp. SGAir0479]